jgi:hypothetical protein
MESPTPAPAEATYDLPSETSIRLLKITHAHVPEEGERSVWFTISSFELDECPDFLALSYTWTDPMRPDVFSTDERSAPGTTAPQPDHPDDTPAFIGERKYKATNNLRDGLVQIMLSGFGRGWIWADAVCIDQENNSEKEGQVAMMDEIYARALAVVVWLGADTADLGGFCWVHGEVFDALGVYIARYGLEDLMARRPLDPGFTARLGVVPPGGSWVEVWREYFRFCRRRRWFSRAWVVQEVTLARQVVVLCGEREVEWDRMVAMGEVMVLLGWQGQVGLGVDEGFGRAMGDEIVRLAAVKSIMLGAMRTVDGEDTSAAEGAGVADTAGTGPAASEGGMQREKWFRTFLALLLHTRVYSATDPRDKIYSLLGILKKTLPPSMDMPFRPDYSEASTPQTLFTSISSMFHGELPNLEALSLVEDRGSRKIKDLPSWVPDYTCHLTGTPLIFLRNSQHAFKCDQTTSGAQGRSAVCSISDGRLSIQGAEFDRVVATASPMWDVLRTQVVDDCLVLCEDLNADYLQRHTGPGEVLWRTMIADTVDQKPAPRGLAHSFRSWVSVRLAVQIMKTTLKHHAATGHHTLTTLDETVASESLDILTSLRTSDRENVDDDSRSLPTNEEVLETARLMYDFQLHDILSSASVVFVEPNIPHPTLEEQTTRIEGQAAAFKNAMSPAVPFRRLYRTARGYLGLGPASVEVGDRVYLLRGAKVPFVLRDGGAGRFELMGETYVHGFMDGQMLSEVGDSLAEIVLV